MKKIWLVFKYEYLRRIKTKGFIFAVISMPLLILIASLMGVVSVKMQTNSQPIGYVDLSSIFDKAQIDNEASTLFIGAIDLLPYENEEAGKEALAQDDIQAFFVIQPDYLENGNVYAYANERPGENAYDRMNSFLETNLITGEEEQIRSRIQNGSNYTVRSLDGSR